MSVLQRGRHDLLLYGGLVGQLVAFVVTVAVTLSPLFTMRGVVNGIAAQVTCVAVAFYGMWKKGRSINPRDHARPLATSDPSPLAPQAATIVAQSQAQHQSPGPAPQPPPVLTTHHLTTWVVSDGHERQPVRSTIIVGAAPRPHPRFPAAQLWPIDNCKLDDNHLAIEPTTQGLRIHALSPRGCRVTQATDTHVTDTFLCRQSGSVVAGLWGCDVIASPPLSTVADGDDVPARSGRHATRRDG